MERGVWVDMVWHILEIPSELSEATARELTEQIVDSVMEQSRADREFIAELEATITNLRAVLGRIRKDVSEDLLAICTEAEDWALQKTPEGTEEAPDGSWSAIDGIAEMALEALRSDEAEVESE